MRSVMKKRRKQVKERLVSIAGSHFDVAATGSCSLLILLTYALSVANAFITPEGNKCSTSSSHHRCYAASISPPSSQPSPSSLSLDEARTLIRQGMESFRLADVNASLMAFDQAYHQVQGLRPFLWQRGLSLYYADRFQEASDQFHIDVSANPNDVEEIVWDIACQLRLQPSVFPPSNMMSVPDVRRDRRRIMPTVYKLFRGDSTQLDLFVAGHETESSPSDEFYSLFYLGLFCEVRGEMMKARSYLLQSVQTAYYARNMNLLASDYMTSVAQVHCKLRGWI